MAIDVGARYLVSLTCVTGPTIQAAADGRLAAGP